jgi:RNA polymerase sigma-70 factor, ECF subfamily
MDIVEEKELVNKAKTDPEAFGCLFDLYYDKIFNYCLRTLENRQNAEDATSEVFFKALESLPKYKWQGYSFGAWLYKIASNEVVNFYRNKNNQNNSLETMQEDFGFDVAEAGDASSYSLSNEIAKEKADEFNFIKKEIINLPEHYAQVLRFRYFEKLSILEIAHILDKPEGTIKSLLSRAVDLLQLKVANRISLTQPLTDNVVVLSEGGK